MLYGLYLSAQGADIQTTRLDVTANNMANASTSAFKRDLAIFQAHHPFDVKEGNDASQVPGHLNRSTGGTSLAEVVTDFSNGALLPTGATYDLALEGPGFFQVGDDKQKLYTRNGHFTINDRGDLVTADQGQRVLDSSGKRIQIPSNAQDVAVDADGTISATTAGSGGGRSILGKIGVFEPASLQEMVKIGDSLYRTEGKVDDARGTKIQQGFLEASGTQPIQEMLTMIDASRAFESNINMMRMQDDTLGQLLQAVPRK